MLVKDREITVSELTRYAREFLSNEYGVSLDIPIVINNRLTRALGKFRWYKEGNKPVDIQLAGRLLKYGSPKTIYGMFRHELIHYALFMLGEPFSDGHPYFENELRKHDAPSTNTVKVGLWKEYKCRKCGKIHETEKKKIQNIIDRCISNCCNCSLNYYRTVIYTGEEKEISYA